MEKIKEFFNNKRNRFISIGVGVVALIIIVVVIVLSGSKGNKLEKRLLELGRVYYKKYYSFLAKDDKKERDKFLSKYTEIGIKVDLENLSRTVANTEGLPSSEEILKDFNKKGNKCNYLTTKVIFYPQEPYGDEDIKMEVNLDCGNKTEK